MLKILAVETQGLVHQKTAEVRDAFQSKQSMHEVGMTDVLNTLPHRQEDLSASAHTADEDSKMDVQTTDRGVARSQLNIRKQCENDDSRDLTCDIENLETHNTKMLDAPL